MKQLLTLLVTLLLPMSAGAEAGGNYVSNGNIEAVDGDRILDWQSSRSVKAQTISGQWRRYTVEFNSGEFEEVNFYFWTRQGSIGSLWIDNVTSTDISIENGGFEQVDEQGNVASWVTDYFNDSTFLDTTRASEGNNSIGITFKNEVVPDTQVYQKSLKVSPNRDYAISYDVYVGDDFQGKAGALVYDVRGRSHITTNFEQADIAGQLTTRDLCEKQVAVLSAEESNPAEMHQDIDLPPGMNLYVNANVKLNAFEGDVAMIVEDPVSGRVLQETKPQEIQDQWQLLRMFFQSEVSKVRLRIIAEGVGEVQVDNVAITSPRITPPVQRPTWLASEKNFRIPDTLRVSVPVQAGPAIAGGLDLLEKDLAGSGTTVERVDTSEAPLQIRIGPEYAVKDGGPEAYRLNVSSSGMVIEAPHEAGAFYGLMTLLQLLEQQEDGLVTLACNITDYPDMPVRGVLYGDAEQAARWKMNTFMVSTGYPSATPEREEEFRKLVSDCEKLNLDLIPYFLSLHGGYYVQNQNPNLAAGVRVKDEEVVLHGIEPSALKNKYVIRTDLTDVQLTSSDLTTKYHAGKDYEVIDGEIFWPYPPDATPKMFSIARLPGSSIPDGATVLASYDYVSQERDGRTETHIGYVPLEPEASALMSNFFEQMARDYPLDYINPSLCLEEFGPIAEQLETDNRVIKSGKSPLQLFVDTANEHQAAFAAGNPSAKTIVWSGHISEYEMFVGPRLSRDIQIQIWGYDANWPLAYGMDAVEYWSKLGFETTVMPWDNLRNVRGWAQVVARAREKGYPCIGMVDSCWFERTGGFEESAIVSWKIPKEGERGFVSIEKTGTSE